MAKPMVPQERGSDVAQVLAAKGADPRISTVQAEIGGGSDQAKLPEAAVDRMMGLGGKVWGLVLAKLH
jgi:hypothetical protein